MSADRPGRRRRRDPHRRPRLPRARTEPVGPPAAQAASRCRPRAGTPRCRRRRSRRRDHRRGRQPRPASSTVQVWSSRAAGPSTSRAFQASGSSVGAGSVSDVDGEGAEAAGVGAADSATEGGDCVAPGPAEHPPIRIATTTVFVRRDRGIQPSIRPECVQPFWRPRPCAMERETRFELATSTLGRWRSAS